mgnify:CR=1 FL=1
MADATFTCKCGSTRLICVAADTTGSGYGFHAHCTGCHRDYYDTAAHARAVEYEAEVAADILAGEGEC